MAPRKTGSAVPHGRRIPEPARYAVALAAIGLGGVLVPPCVGSGCDGGETDDTSGEPDASIDAAPDIVEPPDAEGGAATCPDSGDELPAYVPDGWVRAPCAPENCEVFVAPTPALARSPSPWTDCGAGCLELAHDWGDPAIDSEGN